MENKLEYGLTYIGEIDISRVKCPLCKLEIIGKAHRYVKILEDIVIKNVLICNNCYKEREKRK